MIHLLAMIMIQMLMLLVLRDVHLVALGGAALAIGSAGALASTGTLGEALSRLKQLKILSDIMGQKRSAIETPTGLRVVHVILLPEDLKSELDCVAKVTGTSVNALIIDAIRGRLSFESALAIPKAPTK